MNRLLHIENLQIGFVKGGKQMEAVQGVDLTIDRGQVVAIVGESGCGKSLTALAIMGLIGEKSKMKHTYVNGSIQLQEDEQPIDLLQLSKQQYEKVRGSKVSMIFQEPMTALNPLLTVGLQISEVLIKHKGLSKQAAKAEAIALLEQVGIPDAASRYSFYPFQFSGGQKQRIMIAIAVACDPLLLIADEPTTALDVTIQAQILNLLMNVKEQRQTAMMFITHNLGIVAQFADKVVVMYRGLVVESAPVQQLFTMPQHPYTKLLLGSVPQKGLRAKDGHRLQSIQGTVPSIAEDITGCPFHTRCPLKEARCMEQLPALTSVAKEHEARCHLVERKVLH